MFDMTVSERIACASVVFVACWLIKLTVIDLDFGWIAIGTFGFQLIDGLIYKMRNR